jgi:hypothetical protein
MVRPPVRGRASPVVVEPACPSEEFCIVADTEFAKLEGANEREITEAVAMAGLTRHWSTILNGRQADKAAFKKDINRLVAGAKKHMAAAPAMPAVTAAR